MYSLPNYFLERVIFGLSYRRRTQLDHSNNSG